ncbi:hypothetical protein [Natronorubrum sulfidifaciens]|uniref:Uncharacterized protein n=1 Tax=Natronorubrum sulfidifaciens JCM 14089 TaxID=1230460 RepID=L9W6Z8_9EURY|nr:hypothetical protein [Natronorubrum sulfidifaciens]ELY45249.1 hypothetical protein C495_08255 [Natronorubrum sulfidifaciens JCM 14089]
MRALRTCDFCGDDAAGTFELIPPELEPTDTEQRRVVLCPDCKAHLEDLLEPLLARLDGDSAEPPTETATAHVDEQTPRTADDEAGSDSNGTDSHATLTLEDGITFDAAGTREGAATTDAEPTESPTAEDSTTTADAAEATADPAEEPASNDTRRRPPNGYGNVVRLLQNRELPMARSAVEGLAAGAYDLESHEVDAIIDYALETEEFVEERGELRRP